jgi:hypothetical protein
MFLKILLKYKNKQNNHHPTLLEIFFFFSIHLGINFIKKNFTKTFKNSKILYQENSRSGLSINCHEFFYNRKRAILELSNISKVSINIF